MIEGIVSARRGLYVIAVVVTLVACGGGQTARTDPAAATKDLQASFEHYKAGRYEEAITAAKAALAADPNMADAYNNMAVSYLGLRRFNDGIQAARDAIRLKPDSQLAKNNLAWIEREKANAASPAPPAAPPSPADTLLNQSLQHSTDGRFKECMDTAAQAAKLDPASSRAFTNVGFCAGNLKLWDEAVKNTQEAIRLDPNNQLAKNNLAWIQQQKAQAGTSK